jgi:cobalt-zinc-cadmium resistance protein CzcA
MVLTNLGGEFIPTLEEGDFAVEFRVLPGSNLNTSIERSQKAVHIVKIKVSRSNSSSYKNWKW